MNYWRTSLGERIDSHTLQRNISMAKQIKRKEFLKKHNYIFCEWTGVNASADIIDPMHIISVDECKKMGMADLAYDQRNLRYGARSFHNKFDCKSHAERIEIFETLNNCKL